MSKKMRSQDTQVKAISEGSTIRLTDSGAVVTIDRKPQGAGNSEPEVGPERTDTGSGTRPELASDIPETDLRSGTDFPKQLAWAVGFISILPFLLNLAGFDFSSNSQAFPWSEVADMAPSEKIDAMFYRLTGAFSHTLLEWSAFCAALFTVVLAFIHFKIKRDIVTPIIGLALFWAGCMDAFHTLAAARLIQATADNTNLIPFTWAICRIFNALILILGVSILISRKKADSELHANFRLISIVGLAFGLAAYGIIQYCATSQVLPETMFPDAIFTRPWDVVPLVMFIIAGTVVYPRFHKRYKSHFSLALWISAIPEVTTELHMAFGSTMLFDNHFNIAHFLKIITYLVPLTGLLLSYIQTFNEEKLARTHLATSQKALAKHARDLSKTNIILEKEIEERKRAETEMKKYAEKLTRSNVELEQFAYVASHDLQEPLRKVTNFSELFAKKYSGQVDEKGQKYIDYVVDGAARMQTLIQDLLQYSKLGQKQTQLKETDLQEMLSRVIDVLVSQIQESKAKVTYDGLPTLKIDPAQMSRLFQNLIGNAIKYRGDKAPRIHISAKKENGHTLFSVKDNGIGIKPEFSERIFIIFQRLHTREEYTGTGIGLAICKKIVVNQGGRIWVESEPDKGSTFWFTIPDKWEGAVLQLGEQVVTVDEAETVVDISG